MRIVASALANCVLFVGLLFFMLPSLTRAESPRDCTLPNAEEPAVPQTLRVALYPYTPDRLALFHKIESRFECEDPGVNVVLVSSSNATDKYYNDDPTKQEGFLYVDADIYEIDTILLSDFIARGKIAAIELPFNDFLRESIEAVTRNGQTFAVPHWMCGNFLFYRKTDTELAEVKTWGELRTLLHRRGQSLFVDLKGKSTIGEWYFTSLVSIVGVDGAQRHIVEGEPINADAVDRLQDMLAMCPIGYCRSDKLHDKVGFYARAFVRGQASAFVGYSESIHYGLREFVDDCLSSSGCVPEDEIAVRALPSFRVSAPEAGVGWVDALAIDARLSGLKKELALKFIRRLVSQDVYLSILTPEWPYPSRYLLPARGGFQVPDAPLYPAFIAAHAGRKTGSLPELNKKLRSLANRLDCQLPIDRDDEEAKEKCRLK